MATVTQVQRATGTLTANTVEIVNLTNPFRYVIVSNIDGADRISGTVNGATPTDKGAECFVLPAAICSKKIRVMSGAPQVRLISTTTGTPVYSVEGADV